MSFGPTEEEIMSAMRASGYLMEQEVASHLERRGMHVRTNVAFQDNEEGKSRELDVTAIKQAARDDEHQLGSFVELLVECKNTSNPFVFVSRPKNEADKKRQPEQFVIPFEYQKTHIIDRWRKRIEQFPAFTHLGFDKVYDATLKPWKAVQFCRIDRNGKGWHANHGGLYDALFYPMAKALSAFKKDRPTNNNPTDWRYIWLFFPLVVTSGDLFLIDSSSDEPKPAAVDYITFDRELKSTTLNGTFSITFVRQQALEKFLIEVVDPLVDLCKSLIIDQRELLTTIELPVDELASSNGE